MGFNVKNPAPKEQRRSEKMDTSMVLFAAGSEIPWPVVCLIGVAVVFIGLVAIIGLVSLMTLICNKILDRGAKPKNEAPKAQAPAPVAVPVENRGEIIAAVCAAVAEEEGTDISAIRVVSFKKL